MAAALMLQLAAAPVPVASKAAEEKVTAAEAAAALAAEAAVANGARLQRLFHSCSSFAWSVPCTRQTYFTLADRVLTSAH